MQTIINNISEAKTLEITSGVERALNARVLRSVQDRRKAVVLETYGPSPIQEDAADGDGDGDGGEDNDSDTDPDEESLGLPDDADEERVNLILSLAGLDPEQHKTKKD